MPRGSRTAWLALGLILIALVLSRLPALSNGIHSYPNDSARWAAPAVNFANYGVEHSYLPLIDQGDYGYMLGNYYFRWPLLPFYIYGVWASATSDQTLALRLVPLGLNLVTTLYVYLIASLVFRRRYWALLATLLFGLTPGHFFLSVQISDTQFWVVTLAGSIYHRIRYDQIGQESHRWAHLGLLVVGCLCSWLGYLTVGAHFLVGTWAYFSRSRREPVRYALESPGHGYRLALVGIAAISMAFHALALRVLAGPRGIRVVSQRFFFWVTNRRRANADEDLVQRVVSKLPDLFSNMWEIHLPTLFGWPLITAFLLSTAAILLRRASMNDIVRRDAFLRFVTIYALFFVGYLTLFANHAAHPNHTFAYQQLSPIVAIVVVSAIAALLGGRVSHRAQFALTLSLCLALVMPTLVDYYRSPHLHRGKGKIIESARAFGETVKEHSSRRDFVVTNRGSYSGVAGRVARYTARRTLAFEINEWHEVLPFLDNEVIEGLIYLHWYATDEYGVDPTVLVELRNGAKLLEETDRLAIYRLR